MKPKNPLTDMIKFLAKVMSVPFRLQGQALRVLKKISAPCFASGSIFSKNLACEEHSLSRAKNLFTFRERLKY